MEKANLCLFFLEDRSLLLDGMDGMKGESSEVELIQVSWSEKAVFFTDFLAVVVLDSFCSL